MTTVGLVVRNAVAAVVIVAAVAGIVYVATRF